MRTYSSILYYLILCALAVAAAKLGILNAYVQLILMYVGINIILSTSLNLVNGYMGEFSVGHAGFMAVGAYVTSILNVLLFTTSPVFGPPLLPASSAILPFPGNASCRRDSGRHCRFTRGRAVFQDAGRLPRYHNPGR